MQWIVIRSAAVRNTASRGAGAWSRRPTASANDTYTWALMDRSVLLDHVRRTRLPPGRRDGAKSDARRIAAFLKRHGARRVVGVGSAFDPGRRFTWRSDIDIAVAGLQADRFFELSARAADLTDLSLDIIPIESVTEPMRRAILEEGVDL